MRYVFALFLSCVVILSTTCLFLSPTSLYAANKSACVSDVPPSTPGGTTVLPLPEQTNIIYIDEILTDIDTIQWNCDSTIKTDSIWIELFNPTDNAYNLSDVAVTVDQGLETPVLSFPLQSVILPHNYFVFFPFVGIQQKNVPAETMTQFRLRVNDTIISMQDFPTLNKDTSYARFPGTSGTDPTWEITNQPTIGTQNLPSLAIATATSTSGVTPTATHSTGSTPSSTPQQKHTAGTTHTTGNAGNPSPPNDGNQPSWQALKQPASTSDQQQPASSSLPTIPALLSSTAPDTTPRKLLLSGLTVILAAGIYWGARRWLLRPSKQPTSDPQQKNQP
jgi:hypothetical protein